MILKNIYLGDFGIFQNENLTDIASGIVVIGGGNRSGKTTFMQVLRHLGYGLPRDDSLPPPADEYHIEADLKLNPETAEERFGAELSNFHLKLTGFADPGVTPASFSRQNRDSLDLTAADLYNNLDRFTYRQLFTINLNKLQRKPQEITGQKEEDRLYSVLLGAGLSQIMELPQIARYYFRRAEDIGGKLGNPTVAKFSPYQEKIAEAEIKKEEALKQVEEYKDTVKEIDEVEDKIAEIEKKIARKEQKRIRLDVIKNNYDNFSSLINLYKEIEQHQDADLAADKFTPEKKLRAENLLADLQNARDNYRDKLSKFRSRVKTQGAEEICREILQHSSRLKNFADRLSGLRNKVENFRELKARQQEKYEKLQLEADKINTEWKRDLSCLGAIRTDEIERGRLLEDVETARKWEKTLRKKREKEKELKRELEKIKNQKNNLKDVNSGRIYRLSITGGVLALIAGITAGWFDVLIGAFAAGGGLVLALMFFLFRYQQARDIETREKTLQRKIRNCQQDLDNIQADITAAEEEKDDIEQRLKEYRTKLGLGDQSSLEIIKDYFISLQGLKRRYKKWQLQEQSLQEKRTELENELAEISNVLAGINKEISSPLFTIPRSENIIKNSEQLFSALERALEFLSLAQELAAARKKKIEVERKIETFLTEISGDTYGENADLEQLLQSFSSEVEKCQEFQNLQERLTNIQGGIIEAVNSADRIREAFLNLEGEKFQRLPQEVEFVFTKNKKVNQSREKTLLKIFAYHYNEYTSAAEVNDTYQEVVSELEDLKKALKKKREKLRILKDKKEKLASPEKIESAHTSLDEARTQLRKLAEQYAINRSIDFILNKVKEKAVARAKEELLDPASELLREMTAGEYQEITTAENLAQKDFSTFTTQGEKHESVDTLSRGTREQLFLAVRISRIKEIEPPLPVILDDSLVNFDRFHLSSTTRILSRLGQSHQIFLLTCHPHLVEYIDNSSESAQYWHLEQGEFSKVSARKLKERLSKDT